MEWNSVEKKIADKLTTKQSYPWKIKCNKAVIFDYIIMLYYELYFNNYSW